MILVNNTTSATYELKIKEKFNPSINLSYKFYTLANGNKRFIDRGAASDGYTCRVVTYGKQDYIDGLVEFLQDVRDDGFDMSLSAFNSGETIFGENVVYTSAIDVMITDIGDVAHKTFRGVELGLEFSVDDVTSLTFDGLGNMPVLSCLQAKYIANRDWNYKVNTSYQQKHYVTDGYFDTGLFKGKFILSNDNMKELREFYRQVRGESFTVTSANIKGIDELFGVRGPAYPTVVRIANINEKFLDVNKYEVDITFVEEVSIGVR